MTASERTADLLRRYYSIFNSGIRDEFLTLLADDVVHDINQGGAETGRAAFGEFMKRMDRCYRERVVELQVFASDDGSRGAAEFYIEGEYLSTDEGLPLATGQKYRLRVGAFFDIREGRVARVTNYYNLQDWWKQVGAA
jgi:steroid delta-isomerase-like uncharacterized protein